MWRSLVALLSLSAVSSCELSDANNEFAVNLYASMADEVDTGNLFFSPMSVSLALAMTRAGAMGDTKSQMSQVLALDALADEDISSSFKGLITKLNREDKNYTLDIANRLFGRQDYVFNEMFLNETEENFMSRLEELDFVDDPEGSRTHINDWVANNTQQKIKDLIPEGAIDSATALVLVNAMYFKGLWKEPFDKDDTESGVFHSIKGTEETMDMMHASEYFNYKEDKQINAKILEIPYEGDEVSMLIVLPDDQQGLEVLEEDLIDMELSELFSDLQSNKVKVTLPKFEMTQLMSLKALLVEMGMEHLFVADVADLSGINGKKDLYVTEVVHKSFIQVDEEGTEAAAATGVIVGVTGMLEQLEFNADHPFMYVIWEKTTKSALFMGRLTMSPATTQPIGSFGEEDQEVDGVASLVASFAALFTCLAILFV